MRKFILYILPVFICTIVSHSVVAQDVSVKSWLDTTSILVGQQTSVWLNVDCNKNTSVLWPEVNDTLRAEIEVLRKSPVDTFNIDNDKVSYRQELIITSFDSGYYAVPPFRFVIDPDGIDKELETMAHLLEVHSVKVDTTKTFRDITPIHDMPVTFVEVLPWALLGIVAVALIVFLILFLKRRESGEGSIALIRKPTVPPHRIALDSLDDLKEKRLWQKGDLKNYYKGITDILRVYLEGQFNVSAVEMTTTDILEQASENSVLSGLCSQVNSLFTDSDLVKFAKFKPRVEENEQIWEDARQFILSSYDEYVVAMKSSDASAGDQELMGEEVDNV